MLVRDALILAEGLVDQHLPGQGWTVKIERSTSWAGICRHHKKQIGISADAIRRYPESEVEETILHEIGHALAGHRAAHGPKWAAEVRKLGGHPKKYAPPIPVGVQLGTIAVWLAIVHTLWTHELPVIAWIVGVGLAIFLANAAWKAIGPIHRVYNL